MRALLVRLGVDLSEGGGRWNGPVDSSTGSFTYVPIPEGRPVHPGLEKPYRTIEPVLESFGTPLPKHLRDRYMHLDPDFDCLTYGDQGERAKQIKSNLGKGDFVVFYAGLADIRTSSRLVYAIIGVLCVEDIVLAAEVSPTDWGSTLTPEGFSSQEPRT